MLPRIYRSGFLGTRFIDIEVCDLSSVRVPWQRGRLLGSRPSFASRVDTDSSEAYWLACEAIFLSSSSFSACKLKLAPFCIGGNSSAV